MKFELDVAAVSRLTEREKDLEIMLLRRKLWIVERKPAQGISGSLEFSTPARMTGLEHVDYYNARCAYQELSGAVYWVSAL